ncbi:MAG: hypothetical protein ACI9LG_002473 [Moritella dasanensis]|jgi:hypothetical protein
MTYNLPAYDAGTEANSEAVGTIPGPADGGEGLMLHEMILSIKSRATQG